MGKMAERVWLQDRAQALSLPISASAILRSASLVSGAARLAGDVAGRVGEAMGFDDVLRGAQEATTPADPDQLKADLVASVRRVVDRLGIGPLGIDAGRSLQLSLGEGGRLRVDGDSARAAEIEAALNADPDVATAASQLDRVLAEGGPERRLTIPSILTSQGGPTNILPSSGGYPNW